MPDEHLWTAAELEQLTPDQRARIVKDGIVTDLSELPPEFVERIRTRARSILGERGIDLPKGS